MGRHWVISARQSEPAHGLRLSVQHVSGYVTDKPGDKPFSKTTGLQLV
jgi:hypothetical protein